MGQKFIIDSNVVIDFLSGKLPEKGMELIRQVVDDIPVISVITVIEVLGYKTSKEAEKLLSGFIKDSIVIELSEKVVQNSIKLRKDHKIKIPDAIIAASAITSGLKLITRNIKDFAGVKGIEVIDPHF